MALSFKTHSKTISNILALKDLHISTAALKDLSIFEYTIELIELLTTCRAQTTHTISSSNSMVTSEQSSSLSSSTKTSPFPFSLSSPLTTLSRLLMLDKTPMFNRQTPAAEPVTQTTLPASRGVTNQRRGPAMGAQTGTPGRPQDVKRDVGTRAGTQTVRSTGTHINTNNGQGDAVTYSNLSSAYDTKMARGAAGRTNIEITSSDILDSRSWLDLDDTGLTFQNLAATEAAGVESSSQLVVDDNLRRQRFSSVMSTGSSDESCSDLRNLNHLSPAVDRRGYNASIASSPTSDDWTGGLEGGGYSSVPFKDLNIDPLSTIWPSLSFDEGDQFDNLQLFNFNDVGSQFDADMDAMTSRNAMTSVNTLSSADHVTLGKSIVSSLAAQGSDVDLPPNTEPHHNTSNLQSLARSPVIGSPDTTTSEIMKLLLKSKLSPLSPSSCPPQPQFSVESVQTSQRLSNLGGVKDNTIDMDTYGRLNAYSMHQQQQPVYSDYNGGLASLFSPPSIAGGLEHMLGEAIDTSPQTYLAYQSADSCSTVDTSHLFDDVEVTSILSPSEKISTQSKPVLQHSVSSSTKAVNSYLPASTTSSQQMRNQKDNITNSKLYELIVGNNNQNTVKGNTTDKQTKAVSSTTQGIEASQGAEFKLLQERLRRQWKGMELKKKLIDEMKGEKFSGNSAEVLRTLFFSTLKSQSDGNTQDIKREMEEIFPGTLTDHDYCQHVSSKAAPPAGHSWASSVSSSALGNALGNAGAKTNNAENSTLRNLLLDTNLADEVRKQAAEDRERSKIRMTQKAQCCVNVPNPVIRSMLSGEQEESCGCQARQEGMTSPKCTVETDASGLIKELYARSLSDPSAAADMKDFDWPDLLSTIHAEIDGNQLQNLISFDDEFNNMPLPGCDANNDGQSRYSCSDDGSYASASENIVYTTSDNIAHSSPSNISELTYTSGPENTIFSTHSEYMVYSSPENVESIRVYTSPSEKIVYSNSNESELKLNNQDLYTNTDILDFNLLAEFDYHELTDCIIDKSFSEERNSNNKRLSTSETSQPAGIKTKRTSSDLTPPNSTKLGKKQPSVKRLATISAVNKNKSLNKLYQQNSSMRFMDCCNKL